MSNQQKTSAAAEETTTDVVVVEEAQADAPTAEKAAPKTEDKPSSPTPRGRGGRGRGDNRGGRGRGRRRRNDRPEEKEFEEELLQVRRVTRVVKGGRRLRFSATVVIGDKKGRVGFATDKAAEVPQAIQKAVRKAKKNLVKVPIINGTIPHAVSHKFKAAKIMIMPAKSGTGVIAGGAMRKIAELAGIEDILGKSYGTTNKISTGTAMMEALALLSNKKQK